MKSSLQAFVLIACTTITCLAACGSDETTKTASDAAVATETSRSGLVAEEDTDADNQETETGDKETYDLDQYDYEVPELREDFEISDKFDSGVYENGVNYGHYGDDPSETDPEENDDQRATIGN